MKAHPLAENYPLIEGEEYEAFKADIAARGQLNPIWLYEGMVLDGRNRDRACRDLGVEPRVEEYTGDDPAGFVKAQNEHRRHLTAEWRRGRVAELRAQGMSTRDIAERVGATHTTVIRDLNAAGGTDVPAAPDPPKVTGRDGKQHPARKRRRTRRATAKAAGGTSPSAWAELTDHIRPVAAMVAALGAPPGPLPEGADLCSLATLLEETGRALQARARSLRKLYSTGAA